ncbi:probable chitinase 10 [Bactrocera neohumeralis]|uniref:Chitinase 7 n=5 Tax=Bactrocera TaxID=47832 RepID=A0A2Z2Z004_BACDO|nr:probable chitinase 10 [Bactrocera dorsalis]XP_049312948.1 probable chitinase 10 [Bactrocera dorsalis]XP_050335329.1 probable chitinase 10 [Bactrocera neohumeralis]AUP42569.1 chitinase 7 [Bactrocera dorsalis]
MLPPRLIRVAFVACLLLVLLSQTADSAQTKTRRRLRRPSSTSVSSAASDSRSSVVVTKRATQSPVDEIEKRADQQSSSSVSSSTTTTLSRARGRSKSKTRGSLAAAAAGTALVASGSTLKGKKTKADDGGMKIVCYYTNWSQYRVKIGKFVPEDIPADLCTHIIFAFGWLKKGKLSSYESNDETKDTVPGLYDRMMTLKKVNPKLKILLALGGWSFGTQKFKEMSATRYTRQTFIYSAIPFLRKRGFDGLDMDWEYPKGSDDKKNFVLLLKELREAFEAEAQELKKQRLLLSAAVPVGPDNVRGGYDVPAVASYLDFINLMAYDFHGKWERETGHNAPLYAPSTDSEWRKQLSVDNAATMWVKMGAPKEKLVIGMPTYGRSFTLANTEKHGPNAPATGGGREGVYTKESGFLAYYEICEMLLNGAVYVWDEEMKVPYMVDGDQWVGFDDERAIRNKMHWIKSNGFGGAMVWTIDMDDFKGEVCGGNVKYPLIGAMREELLGISRGKEAKDVNWTAVAATFEDLEEEEEKPAPIKIDVEELLSKVRKPSKKHRIKSGLVAKEQNTRPAQVFCYLTSWSAKRPGAGKFLPSNVDPKLCTHVVYAFATLKDHKLSEATDDDPENYEQVIALREENPDIQILLAIGGWAFGSKPFKELTSNVFRMNQFVYEAIDFLRDYKFNGLDVDWEYPRGAEDRAAYVNLLRELRVAFEGEAKSSGQPRLLLTAAVPASFEAIAAGYDVPEISKYLDFINVMTYDFHGQWERTVGHNSPLFPLEATTGYQKKLTVDYSAREWVKQGAPKEKLLIGMPTYGRSFELVNETQFDIGAPASGGGKAGKFTNEAGFLSYYEVCSFLAADNTTLVWDSEQQVPFAYRGNQWVGFDDERSLKTKMEWLKEQGFGGIMVWSIDMDDFSGRCGAGKYPLLTALSDELKEYKVELEYEGPYESHGPRGAYTTKDPHDVTCEEEDGHISYHKDWNDCTHYYMCEGERKHHMPCPANLVFNPQENVCDWPENVEGCHQPTEAPA